MFDYYIPLDSGVQVISMNNKPIYKTLWINPYIDIWPMLNLFSLLIVVASLIGT